MTERTCAACGASIEHKRRGAECCSNRCRAALSRRRNRTADVAASPNGDTRPTLTLVGTTDRPACGNRHAASMWWRSTHGQLVCGLCHPPAHDRLVTRWEIAA